VIIAKGLKKFIVSGTLLGFSLAAMLVAGVALYLNPRLPDVEELRDFKLQIPLKIYTADGLLIAEFGEQRRSPIAIENVPDTFKKAILAAEDDGFYEHYGISLKGMTRVAFELLTPGGRQTGGSTITMQVARNYLLTLERTISRKINELLLTLQIEKEFTKEEILELYINKIFLGNRAYGFEAASQVYYGIPLSELNIAQHAMLAGIPTAPSRLNPIANPERAMARRDWILGRMLGLEYIKKSSYDQAIALPVTAKYHGSTPEVEAPYIAEMVRAKLLEKYNTQDLYGAGYQVYTTVQSSMQIRSNNALRNGLLDYDRRHGYRGAEGQLVIDPDELTESIVSHLQDTPAYGPLHPAVVIEANELMCRAMLRTGEEIVIQWEGLSWARPYLSVNSMGPKPAAATDILSAGDQIRVLNREGNWELAQTPQAQSALVSLNPSDGAINALTGGFSFQQSKFNRATQAARQPGSNFKPFIYASALHYGYSAASIVNDAPVVFDDPMLERAWRPENDSGKFYGPTRLREALYRSRNMVSIRLLRALGISRAISYVDRFGFPASKLPNDLSLALGSAEFTPLEIATGYTVFANGGYRVEPYFIQSIFDSKGGIVYRATPQTVCPSCELLEVENEDAGLLDAERVLEQALLEELNSEEPNRNKGPFDDSILPDTNSDQTLDFISTPQVKRKIIPATRIIDARLAYIVHSMLTDVIRLGTGRKAQSLGRNDLAGKTGTTNDARDAWFSGYNANLVTSVWVGFDQPATLGRNEYGGAAALPIWIDYMRGALSDKPEAIIPVPEDIVTVRIDSKTGRRATSADSATIFEIFRAENIPPETGSSDVEPQNNGSYGERLPEQLF